MIVDYNKSRSWWWLYRTHVTFAALGGHPLFGQLITYSRERAKMMQDPEVDALTWHTAYWDTLVNDPTHGLGIPTSANILFVGAGFGFMADVARAAGYTSLSLIDDSNWIHDHKNDPAWSWSGSAWVNDVATQALEPIHQASLDATQSIRNYNKTIWGGQGNADWVITEFMLSSLTDPSDPRYSVGEGDADELAAALADCDALLDTGGTVVHLVSPTVREPFNVKTLAEWRTQVTADGHPAHRIAPSYVGQDWEVL